MNLYFNDHKQIILTLIWIVSSSPKVSTMNVPIVSANLYNVKDYCDHMAIEVIMKKKTSYEVSFELFCVQHARVLKMS